MLFNSIDFFIFLSVTFVLYTVCPFKYKWAVLFIGSNFFLAYANWQSLVLLYVVMASSYYSAIMIFACKEKKRKKTVLVNSVIFLAVILSVFKYAGFFTGTLNFILNSFSIKDQLSPLHLILPLGISFYIFQAIGFVISVYRGEISTKPDIRYYGLYLFFFPKLLAGPIERAENFLPQVLSEKKINYSDLSEGTKLIILGLFKKLVISDRIAIYSNTILSNYEQHSSKSILIAASFYTIQIYTDFSGYTDIARGVSKLFGYNLMENFERPLLAQNITSFWRKWHISLSTWAMDYIYYPIVISKRDWKNYSVLYATLLTFLLIGIWHGPTWNFVLFGLLQAVFVYMDFVTKKFKKRQLKKIQQKHLLIVYRFLSWVFTLSVIIFSMVFFRFTNLHDIYGVFSQILHSRGGIFLGTPAFFIYSVIGILSIFILDLWKEFSSANFLFRNSNAYIVRQIPYGFFIILILLIGVYDGGEFIYFQF